MDSLLIDAKVNEWNRSYIRFDHTKILVESYEELKIRFQNQEVILSLKISFLNPFQLNSQNPGEY